MIPTGLHVFREKISIFSSPPRDLYVGITQQHQTTLNRDFQEFHKVHLNKTKNLVCPVEYAVLSEQWFRGENGEKQKHFLFSIIICYNWSL